MFSMSSQKTACKKKVLGEMGGGGVVLGGRCIRPRWEEDSRPPGGGGERVEIPANLHVGVVVTRRVLFRTGARYYRFNRDDLGYSLTVQLEAVAIPVCRWVLGGRGNNQKPG